MVGASLLAAIVYLCDSGVMRDHEEFARAEGSNVIAGIPGHDAFACLDQALDPCFGAEGNLPLSISTHGTATASVVAGRETGVAPNAQLISVVTLSSDVEDWLESFDAIIRHAWNPATPHFRTAIVSMSAAPGLLGSNPRYVDFERKMRAMIGGVDAEGRPDPNGKRFLFVTLAGNVAPPGTPRALAQCDTDGNSRVFPAVLGPGIDGLITVGGATQENRYWVGSCGGPAVELLAPAKDIDVATITGRDHYRSGTSYAAPYVAGLAALLLEKEPDLTPEQIETRLKASASYTTDRLEAPAGGRVASFAGR